MQPRQPQTSDRRVPSSPPVESADICTASWAETSKPSKYATTVALALKEKTGFPTYAAFLEENDFGYLSSLNDSTSLRNHSETVKFHCAIIDLSRERVPAVKVSLRCANLSALHTLLALSEPPKDLSVQIVVLSVPHEDSLGLASEFSSLFGLGFDLAPRFYDALTAQLERHADFEVSNIGRFRCRYLLASGAVVAIARRFALARPELPFVVLIAGPPRIHNLVDHSALYEMLNCRLTIHEPVYRGHVPGGGNSDNGGAIYYAHLLSCLMRQNRDCIHDCDDLPLASLVPLLQLDVLRLRELCSVARGYFSSLNPLYTRTTIMKSKTVL